MKQKNSEELVSRSLFLWELFPWAQSRARYVGRFRGICFWSYPQGSLLTTTLMPNIDLFKKLSECETMSKEMGVGGMGG